MRARARVTCERVSNQHPGSDAALLPLFRTRTFQIFYEKMSAEGENASEAHLDLLAHLDRSAKQSN
eukprot:COSAG03_NODE_1910_length_3365_cov_19.062156_9_plen_65_part_01